MAKEESKPVDFEQVFAEVDAKAEKVKDGTDTDVTKKDTPSSEGDESEQDETELRDKVEGLQKELARVRQNKNKSADEVQGLREELARVQGQLETLVKTGNQGGSESNRLAKFSDSQLVQGQTEWEDELLNARDAVREARKGDNPALVAQAEQALRIAKQTLDAIRVELHERTKRVGVDQAKAQGEANKLVEEIVDLYDNAYDAFPDLKDKDSEIWQAGNEEFISRPSLMRQLGPLGELVAVAIAITNNPDLVGGKQKAKAARKELLSEISDKAETALVKGGGKAKSKVPTDFNSMGMQDFEALVRKAKGN